MNNSCLYGARRTTINLTDELGKHPEQWASELELSSVTFILNVEQLAKSDLLGTRFQEVFPTLRAIAVGSWSIWFDLMICLFKVS